jgi:hypothetical protein
MDSNDPQCSSIRPSRPIGSRGIIELTSGFRAVNTQSHHGRYEVKGLSRLKSQQQRFNHRNRPWLGRTGHLSPTSLTRYDILIVRAAQRLSWPVASDTVYTFRIRVESSVCNELHSPPRIYHGLKRPTVLVYTSIPTDRIAWNHRINVRVSSVHFSIHDECAAEE